MFPLKRTSFCLKSKVRSIKLGFGLGLIVDNVRKVSPTAERFFFFLISEELLSRERKSKIESSDISDNYTYYAQLSLSKYELIIFIFIWGSLHLLLFN